jgi:MoaA/NifB/PqqE/SkfB family radical SAM enzyme
MNNINGPKKIGLEIKATDRCNQECIYCVNSDGKNGVSDVDSSLFKDRMEEWLSLNEKSAWEICEIRITGGEPLLNKSGTISLIKTASANGITSGINTNGSLITVDIKNQLKAAGLKIVKISLDALSPDIYRKICGPGTSHENTLNGIRISVKAGFEVIIRFTLSGFNRHELVRCYDYASSLGVSKFQIKPLIEAGRGKTCGAGLSHNELQQVMKDFSRKIQMKATIPEVLCYPPDQLFGLPGKACGSANKIYISCNGQVSVCNYISKAFIGDLTSDSIEEILNTRSLSIKTDLVNNQRLVAGCPHYRKNTA